MKPHRLFAKDAREVSPENQAYERSPRAIGTRAGTAVITTYLSALYGDKAYETFSDVSDSLDYVFGSGQTVMSLVFAYVTFKSGKAAYTSIKSYFAHRKEEKAKSNKTSTE
jgi:hypothetical protein